ncbi:MAG TPA: SRPBCC family protein [Ornithinibacter sp.]|nr:SRPBCC family protein [Ornithinibacter sp.]
MPTDTARAEQRIAAPTADVLEAIHDVAAQPEWIPEIREVEVLEVDADGLPLRAAIAAATAVGTDRYTLRYSHRTDGIAWTLESGRLQTRQEGELTAVPAADGSGATTVAYALTIEHPLPLPGFVRSRIIRGLVSGSLDGLRARLEAP